jgi:hypothetical protein
MRFKADDEEDDSKFSGLDFTSVNITLYDKPLEGELSLVEIDIFTCGFFKYSSNIVKGRLTDEDDESLESDVEELSNPYTNDNILLLLTFTGC